MNDYVLGIIRLYYVVRLTLISSWEESETGGLFSEYIVLIVSNRGVVT
jgi:hypothetical protein